MPESYKTPLSPITLLRSYLRKVLSGGTNCRREHLTLLSKVKEGKPLSEEDELKHLAYSVGFALRNQSTSFWVSFCVNFITYSGQVVVPWSADEYDDALVKFSKKPAETRDFRHQFPVLDMTTHKVIKEPASMVDINQNLLSLYLPHLLTRERVVSSSYHCSLTWLKLFAGDLWVRS